MSSAAFRAFQSRNYRYFFFGQALSLLGTWMQKTAVSWVVYTQTQSKLMLGVSVFATLFPSAVFSLLGGVASDRYSRYRILLLTQVLSLVQAAVLAFAVYFQQDAVWSIIGLSAVLGAINGFDVPARQALVYDLVTDKGAVPNAVALNSSMVNLAKLLGPAVAGFALEHLGAAACFGLNAVSFGAVIGSLLMLRLPAFVPRPITQRVGQELADAFRYVRRTPDIRFIMAMVGLVCLVAQPFTTLMPVYAKDIFHGTASTFGLLDGAIGLGGFLGALYLAGLPAGTDLNRVLTVNTFLFAAGLLLLAYTPWYGLALAFLVVAAFGMMAQFTINLTLLQTSVLPALRGRVISIYVLVFTGALPVGSLLVGLAAHFVGVQLTVLVQGVGALGIGLLYWRALRRRRPLPPGAPAPGLPVALAATAAV